MLSIGVKKFPSNFIKKIELDKKDIVVSFYLNYNVRVNFKSQKAANEEYQKALNSFTRMKKRSGSFL